MEKEGGFLSSSDGVFTNPFHAVTVTSGHTSYNGLYLVSVDNDVQNTKLPMESA